MSQPSWRYVANLGDATPLDHGGYFVYEDTTGVYGFEAERLERESDEEKARIEVRRVCLDRLKEVRDGDTLYLVPYKYEESWPHPVSAYVEWFAKDLESIAATFGSTADELRRLLCSENGLERAEGYRMVYDHHGWDNGDSEPMRLTVKEARKRYRDELKRTH